jgi:hypothetical protein
LHHHASPSSSGSNDLQEVLKKKEKGKRKRKEVKLKKKKIKVKKKIWKMKPSNNTTPKENLIKKISRKSKFYLFANLSWWFAQQYLFFSLHHSVDIQLVFSLLCE